MIYAIWKIKKQIYDYQRGKWVRRDKLVHLVQVKNELRLGQKNDESCSH